MKIQLRLSSDADLRPASDRTASRGFEKLLFPVILLLVFVMAARTPLDTDMWWHLRAGEETWSTRQVVLQDSFSYTRAGEPWINHSWLSQVSMYLVYHFGGPLALSASLGLLAAISMAFVYRQMEGHPLLRGFILVLASAVASFVWSTRPQLVSLVLFGGVGYLLYLYKWRGQDRLWWMVPVFILWSNLHGGYVLGFLLTGAMLGGELFNHLLGYNGPEILSGRKILRLAGFGLLCGFAVLINPNGLRTWLIPFQTVGVQALQDHISEWASPDFHQIPQQVILWLLFAVILAVGNSSRRLDGTDLAMLVGFGYMAFVARRNYGPFAMAAAPVLSRHLSSALAGWTARVLPAWTTWWERHGWKKKSNTALSPAVTRAINVLIVSLLVLLSAVKWIAVSSPAIFTKYEQEMFPRDAADWVQTNRPPGKLFNSYTWGGYLLWNLRDYPVFLDGRTDLYNDQIIGEWMQVVNAAPGWDEVLDRWEIRLVLVEPDRPLVRALDDAGWQLLYQDEISVVYGR